MTDQHGVTFMDRMSANEQHRMPHVQQLRDDIKELRNEITNLVVDFAARSSKVSEKATANSVKLSAFIAQMVDLQTQLGGIEVRLRVIEVDQAQATQRLGLNEWLIRAALIGAGGIGAWLVQHVLIP